MSEMNRLRRDFAWTKSVALFGSETWHQSSPIVNLRMLLLLLFCAFKETPPVNSVATPKLRQKRRRVKTIQIHILGKLTTIVTNDQMAAYICGCILTSLWNNEIHALTCVTKKNSLISHNCGFLQFSSMV